MTAEHDRLIYQLEVKSMELKACALRKTFIGVLVVAALVALIIVGAVLCYLFGRRDEGATLVEILGFVIVGSGGYGAGITRRPWSGHGTTIGSVVSVGLIVVGACLLLGCETVRQWEMRIDDAGASWTYTDQGQEALVKINATIGPVELRNTVGLDLNGSPIIDYCTKADVGNGAMQYWLCTTCDLSSDQCEVCFGLGAYTTCQDFRIGAVLGSGL